MKKIFPFIISLFCASLISQTTVSTVTPEIEGSGGLSIDSNGNVYIADFGDSLGGPDADGLPNDILLLDTNGNLSVFSTGFIGASGNDFDSSGTLYQSDIWDSGIYKIVGGVRTFVTSDGIVAPVGLVFDSSDNFYVCNCGNNTIQKITPGGTSTLFSSGSMFGCPNGMTIDEDNNLYVVNFSNTNIVKIDPSGTPSVIANTVAGNGHIDYDPNTGNLYIASFGGQQIFYLNKDDLDLTVLAGTAGVRGNDDGPVATATFSNPNGVAVSDDGDSIYINSAVEITGSALNPQYVRLISGVLDLFSIEDNEGFNYEVKTFPNPAIAELNILANLPEDVMELNIQVYDLAGKLIMEVTDVKTEAQKLNVSLDVSSLSSGQYLYSISDRKGPLFNGKLIKK